MKKKMIKTNYLFISLLMAAAFINPGCNNSDLNSPATTDNTVKTGYLNPLRNAGEPSRKVINSSDFALVYCNPSPYRTCSNNSARRFYLKSVVGNSIQYFMDQLSGSYYSRVALTGGGLVVAINDSLVNIGHFYGDSSGISWTGDQGHGLYGYVTDMTLSEYNELVVFTYDYSTHQIFYSVGLVNFDFITWVQQNQLLVIPAISSPALFAADIGNGWEDTLAFVYYDGRTEYRQNCHLNFGSDYSITLGTANLVTCGVPTALDISLDTQNHCVWVQEEYSNNVATTWLCSQPDAYTSSWSWTGVGAYRYQPRVSLNNGKAIVLTLYQGRDSCLTTLYNATAAPAVYLSETYVYSACATMLGATDISF